MFHILTEYERGRAQIAIEWIARAQKPIVEIGGRSFKNCDLNALAEDLNLCIAQSGEVVRGFVIPFGITDYCCYGFYRYRWVINALLSVQENELLSLDPQNRVWVQGLLFGYSPDAIQRFISSSSLIQVSTEPSLYTVGNVEIFHISPTLLQPHSDGTDKSLRLQQVD